MKSTDQEAVLVQSREEWVKAKAGGPDQATEPEAYGTWFAEQSRKYDEWLAVQEKTTIVWRQMNGWESMLADGFAMQIASRNASDKQPMGVPHAYTAKMYAVCSLRKLNGSPVSPLSSLAECMNVAQALSTEEITLLMGLVFPDSNTGAAELKNAPAALPSEA